MKKVLKEEILKLRQEGKKYKEIRKVLGCTMSVISYHCKNAGLSSPNIFRKPSKEEIELINELYKQKVTIKKISEQIGYSTFTIKKYKTSNRLLLTRSQSVVNWRKDKKRKLVEYKGGKCEICGYNKTIEALTFHHMNPLEKDFTISGKSWSFEKLKKEVDKCALLCANCHIEVHQNLHKDRGY